jgi:hypothetical protein
VSVIEQLAGRERVLWVAAVVFYGIGDTVTTAVGLRATGAREVGPIAGPILEATGVAGLVGLKSGFVVACAGVWYLANTPGRVAIPLALTVAGGGVTLWNIAMLASS